MKTCGESKLKKPGCASKQDVLELAILRYVLYLVRIYPLENSWTRLITRGHSMIHDIHTLLHTPQGCCNSIKTTKKRIFLASV